jgi:hypothetical protein
VRRDSTQGRQEWQTRLAALALEAEAASVLRKGQEQVEPGQDLGKGFSLALSST